MRFGKTFASYQLAKKMGLSRILILTFKPAVESAWREDLVSHIDFEGWQYISNKDARNNNLNIDQEFKRADKSRPIVVFGSFQDLLGTNESGGIKTKNEFIHATNWDLVIFDPEMVCYLPDGWDLAFEWYGKYKIISCEFGVY